MGNICRVFPYLHLSILFFLLTLDEAQKGLVFFDSIPLRYIKPDYVPSIKARITTQEIVVIVREGRKR